MVYFLINKLMHIQYRMLRNMQTSILNLEAIIESRTTVKSV